ncbi:hypothetical protein [Paraburkholderia sp. BL21I4N1]|uniref:hypothetical protein n=1 Tax=Paraburkholderia sp. BL21I4N1 TaxID=1938801 RepID=UPI000CFCD17D|nr:hypothetical protein [Paraburkholderia sp. BL21I4N1]PQV52161.1 hypothetical protein B0G83_104381 [Paraburkholderia sp. BL21I4N1]
MIRRALAIIALALAQQAYAKPLAIPNDDSAADKAIAITTQYQLTHDNVECLQFDTFDKGTFYVVRVREIRPKACGGAPDVSPTLFFLKIRKSYGRTLMSADGDGSRYVLPKRVTKSD